MFDALAKPRPSRDLNMIPLINIVLLLLIFFLIAGQQANTPEIQLPVSDSDRPIERHEITLALDPHNRLWLNGEQTGLEALGAALQAATAEKTIVLRADTDVTADSLDGVLDVLRAQGITTVTLSSLHTADTT